MIRQSYKNAYPFRLCCPSFIYPAGYVENVRKLGSCVDEIELLLLESAPGSLPTKTEMLELKTLAAELDLSYNIHLPTDISPGAVDNIERGRSVDALLRAVDLASVLCPTSYTLHLPYTGAADAEKVAAWQDRVDGSLQKFLTGSGLLPDVVAVETLDYPPHFLYDLLERTGLSVCLDTGHLMLAGYDCQTIFSENKQRLSIIHTHGVSQGHDHLSLDHLDGDQSAIIFSILSEFQGSVSLEVFALSDLIASLEYLSREWPLRNNPLKRLIIK